MSEYDTQEPILVLIRRGRKGRGFSISAVDDLANPAMCADVSELGEAIIELLDDPSQPRVNPQDLMAAAAQSAEEEEEPEIRDGDEETDEEDEEEEEDGGILEGIRDAEDPADQLLINLFTAAINKGRDLSSRKKRRERRYRGRRRRK